MLGSFHFDAYRGRSCIHFFYLPLYILATCYFVPQIYLVPDNLTLNFDIHNMDIQKIAK